MELLAYSPFRFRHAAGLDNGMAFVFGGKVSRRN